MIKRIISILFFIFFLGSLILFTKNSKALNNEEAIESFNVKITVNTDSSVDINEEINYYFPSPRHGIFRYIPYRYLDKSNNKHFKTPIENISITNQDNQELPYTKSQSNNYLELKIGDPDKTIEGLQVYNISYTVTGVLNYFDDHDELYWNVTGDDWKVPVEKISVEVTLPPHADSIQSICYTGPTGNKDQNCTISTLEDSDTEEIKILSDTGPLTIVVGWNKGIVTPIERTYEISLRRESPWFWLVALFSLVFLLFKYFKTGRDPAGRGTIAPEFEPPENLKPGEMGALIDEKAQNHDISATIIDFAVRGFLKIRHKNKKYTLIKIKEADSTFNTYEKDVFNSIFKNKKEVKLKEMYKGFSNFNDIKNKIFKSLIDKKYFLNNPRKVRNKYYLIGILICFLCGIFFWLSWHLVGAIFISGVMILIFASKMPKRTREGVIAKEKSYGFKEFLYRAERYRVKWQEKEHIFEKYLPYAMIFGIAEVWAKNFSSIYKQPPDWYEGDFATFSTIAFASQMSSFSQTATHSFSAPATSASSGSSGFGGGGSSGGGFGGGGGGSW